MLLGFLLFFRYFVTVIVCLLCCEFWKRTRKRDKCMDANQKAYQICPKVYQMCLKLYQMGVEGAGFKDSGVFLKVICVFFLCFVILYVYLVLCECWNASKSVPNKCRGYHLFLHIILYFPGSLSTSTYIY